MRMPSGVVDQAIYFVALDSTDLKTRETGLTSFTVYRSRNGGTATAMTTPTVAELSAGNMPGVYSLLLDEDMTIDSGDDSQEMVFHITQASMAPVTRAIELYRPKLTAGETLTVASGVARANDASGNAVAPASALAVVDGIVDDILVDTAEIGAAGAGLTNINLPNQTMDLVGNITGNVSGSVGSVTAGVTLAASAVQAIWDALTSALTTVGSIGKLLVDNLNATISSRLASASYTTPPTVGAIADQVWEEAVADHSGTAGSTALALAAAGSAGDPWVTALPGAYGAGSAGKIVGDNVNATISSRSSHSAADIWAVGSRTLTSFGTLVADIWSAVVDSSGVTTLLSRLSAVRAGYLDNLSAGAAALESSLQALITTVGVAGAGLTATATAVWAVATRLLTAGTNIVLAKGTGLTGLNDLSAAQVNAEADTALSDVGLTPTITGRIDAAVTTRASQGSVDDLPTNAELATALGTADDPTLAAIAALNNLSQANVRTAVGLASANLDTQLSAKASQVSVDDLPTTAELATALGTADDPTLAAIASLSIPTALENADALLKRDMSAITGEAARSPLNAFRFNRNRFTIAGGTLTVYEEDDTTIAWTAAITQTAGNPVSASDPG